MLKLYNKSHVYLGTITQYSKLKIETTVSSGDKKISFTLLDSTEVRAEYYIRTESDEYVVKEINSVSGGSRTVYGTLNREELEAKAWKTFSVVGTTIDAAARLAIAGTGWTVGTCTVSKVRNAGVIKKNALGVLTDLCAAFMCEPVYDTINKTVSFYGERGSDRGVYFRDGLNLRKLTVKTDSYDFFTRIIPYGKDDLDITAVNNGCEYVENYQYSNKIRTYIWIDTNYTDAQALKEDATAKLADLSKPKIHYSATVVDLANLSSTYTLFDYGPGDTIRLVDRDTGTCEKQRIVKMAEYPQTPENNTVELANTWLTWEEMQGKLQTANQVINALVSSDGQYNGTIKVSDILHFENGVVASGVTLGGFYQSTTGAIGALELDVGTLQANSLTAESADIRYAKIDMANVGKATIGTLLADVGLITSATIQDGHVTGYLDSVSINANSITAGTLSVNRLLLRGTTGGIVYALNNFGQLVSSEVNTIDGYILTDQTIEADKIIVDQVLANRIFAETITATGTITGAGLIAGYLKSNDYAYSTGYYSSSGMIIDMSGKTIRAPNFAVINGNVYAKGGTVGGWTISGTALYTGTNSMSSTAAGTYLGTDGIRQYASAAAYVNIQNGVITAAGANISGTITATNGTIGGVSMDSRYGLYTNGKTDAASTASGFLISNGGDIYLGAYNSAQGSCPFQVTSAGQMTATTGKIGPFTFTSTAMYSNGHSTRDAEVDGVYIGNDYLAFGSGGAFWISNTGEMKVNGRWIYIDSTRAGSQDSGIEFDRNGRSYGMVAYLDGLESLDIVSGLHVQASRGALALESSGNTYLIAGGNVVICGGYYPSEETYSNTAVTIKGTIDVSGSATVGGSTVLTAGNWSTYISVPGETYFKYAMVTSSTTTVAAGGVATIEMPIPSVQGYTFLGYRAVECSNRHITISSFSTSGNGTNFCVKVHNPTSGDINVTVTAIGFFANKGLSSAA